MNFEKLQTNTPTTKKENKISENFSLYEISKYQEFNQKFDILLNKFESQINTNNYFANNLCDTQKSFSEISKKINFLDIKIDKISQNNFFKNANMQTPPEIN